MRLFLLFLLVGILFFPIYKAIKDKTLFYQLPCLISITTLAFILPTLVVHVSDYSYVNDQEYILYISNAILCILGSYLGYTYNPNINLDYNRVYSLNGLLLGVAPFMMVGFFISYFLIDPTTIGEELGGSYAILIYFGRLIRPAAIIVFSVWLFSKNKIALLLFILYLIVSLQFIIIAGRRSEVFTLAITILLPLFFVKNFIPSKRLGILLTCLGVMVFLILPLIREYTKQGQFSEIKNLSFQTSIESYYEGDKTNEILEAAINMNVVFDYSGYSYGSRFINKFVNQFASGTLFGPEFKEDFKIKTFDLASARDVDLTNSNYKGYLAHSGFADTFYDFGYFSCIVFFFFARLSKILWNKAFFSNDLFYKMFYSYFVSMIFLSVYDSISFIPTTIVLSLIVFYIVFKTSYLGRRVY